MRERRVMCCFAAIALLSAGLFASSASPAGATTLILRLSAGQTLRSGDSLRSPNGCFSLEMQSDGNAVVYAPGHLAKWASNTSGYPGSDLEMQGDGNAVVYSSGHLARWASGTAGYSSAYLVMQDDGNLVVYSADGVARWASGTNIGCSPVPPPPPPPSPAPKLGNGVCDSGEICVWSDYNYKGCINEFIPPATDFNFGNGSPKWSNCAGSMNDKISSYKNRNTTYYGIWYTAVNQGGFIFCANPGASSADLRDFRAGFSAVYNDSFSGVDGTWKYGNVLTFPVNCSARDGS